jgi:hypothetical protein
MKLIGQRVSSFDASFTEALYVSVNYEAAIADNETITKILSRYEARGNS